MCQTNLMKVALIFRGDNVRGAHSDGNRKYIDAVICWNNWKKTLVDDLENNGHQVDIIFITYESNIIDQIKDIIDPIYIGIQEKTNQRENFGHVIDYIKSRKNKYDRYVIMRCDFRYRFPITQWPKWNETGIFLMNKDVHWPSQKLYADVLFMVDKNEIDNFELAYKNGMQEVSIHALGKYLYQNNIPFHLLYEDYYHKNDHPLQSMASLEDEPDLSNPYNGTKIIDVSQWN